MPSSDFLNVFSGLVWLMPHFLVRRSSPSVECTRLSFYLLPLIFIQVFSGLICLMPPFDVRLLQFQCTVVLGQSSSFAATLNFRFHRSVLFSIPQCVHSIHKCKLV
jgi:hypothetical protein